MSVLYFGATEEWPVQRNEFLRTDCLQNPQNIDILVVLLILALLLLLCDEPLPE